MAEYRETPWNRVVTQPPRFLDSLDTKPMPWAHPFKSRRQELDTYEREREQGRERDPELEQRLYTRRQRQMQHHIRSMNQEPPSDW